MLSQILAWLGWSATYEVVKPPPTVVEEIDVGGSMMPVELLPPERPTQRHYEVVTETSEINGLLSADGIPLPDTSFVGNFMAFTAAGIILIVMIGVGVSGCPGPHRLAHPQAGRLRRRRAR
ncbi:MAG: hypothetical protein R2697_09680 [Ilumatobacteraceae bacterium]